MESFVFEGVWGWGQEFGSWGPVSKILDLFLTTNIAC